MGRLSDFRWSDTQRAVLLRLLGRRCVECRDRIYYEQGVWWHAELANDHDHAALPEARP